MCSNNDLELYFGFDLNADIVLVIRGAEIIDVKDLSNRNGLKMFAKLKN